MLAYSTINQLSFIISGSCPPKPHGRHRCHAAHSLSRFYENYAVFMCRCHRGHNRQKNDQRFGRSGQGVADYPGRVYDRRLRHVRGTPLAGFISKWHVALGAVESGAIFFLLIIVVGSLLDVVYFFPVIRTAFFGKMSERPNAQTMREKKTVDVHTEKKGILEYRQPIHLFMIVPLAITAIFSILLCFFPNTLRIYDLAQMAVKNIFGDM